MKLSYLVKGLPGHPLHPPLTDFTIGTYTFATVASILDVANLVEDKAAYAWWIALVVGLCSTALTATTGFVDWLEIEWGSELWKTATAFSSMPCKPNESDTRKNGTSGFQRRLPNQSS